MKARTVPAGLAVAVTMTLAACSSSDPGELPQPPTAAQVAAQLHLTGFTDCGPLPLSGVTDSGTAYRGAKRIGLDTFPGQDERDNWEDTALQLGIVPLYQDSTWVAYVAVYQSGEGCD